MKIRPMRGRTFSADDTRDHPPVVVIDEVLAQKYFSNEDPLGKRLSLAIPSPNPPPMYEIIGIVEHVKNYGLDGRSPVQPQFYLNFNQIPDERLPSQVKRLNLVVRADSDPLALASAVRREIFTLDKDHPVFSVQTMEKLIGDTIAAQRFSMLLLTIFAFTALVLTAVGIYAVMAYSVSQRKHEIGIRMALGGRALDMFKLVLGHGMTLTIVGIGIGLSIALALTRLMASLLFGVGATDPSVFAATALLLVAVAIIAILVPARRATCVDPMIALRHD
jgi:putative ABC transport system permease protein